jgi:hypothetical protein
MIQKNKWICSTQNCIVLPTEKVVYNEIDFYESNYEYASGEGLIFVQVFGK